jgi:ribosome-binding factor A
MRRVAELIQRELANLLQKKSNDPRFLDVAITRVELSRDFSHGKIYITTLKEEEALTTVAALNKAAGFLRHNLAENLALRKTPKLQFYYDEALIKGEKLSQMIDDAIASDVQGSKNKDR